MECSEFKTTSAGKQKTKKVGHSKFYDVSPCLVASEKQDIMKPEDFVEEGNVSRRACFTQISVKGKMLDEPRAEKHVVCDDRIEHVVARSTRVHHFQRCYIPGGSCNKRTKIGMRDTT